MIPQSFLRAASRARTTTSQTRSIAIGTDLTTSEISWQKARPWGAEDGACTISPPSTLAVDNARDMKEIFKGKKIAVFGIPAPFTGTCTNEHVPGYKKLADEFKSKGVDEVICYSVSCPYAHWSWAKSMAIDLAKISFVADVDAEWAKENKLDVDFSAHSLGVRSDRFSMFVENGVVKSFQIVEDASEDASVLLSQV
mmetsp:Transcript_46988/g.69592  ORF Transcript_46988/g.69592 Transcript_46988/m.69592 type:complete len:197 (+) Transcript_46988:109-699(+)|eukprot:CAMPEP_0195512842 /NCGR_PEP_ID=MMETSP0794_2-20130614/4659_1 /TAXON_ID=515487 /ORGANISM="Stephanopyxis turris, Strain CCMP 815" /LENGTH=196 /DNA_ID=CAMNT_0040640715 /DNA_START=164 /DNA_END=754 /DNA_ORIENTATION=-